MTAPMKAMTATAISFALALVMGSPMLAKEPRAGSDDRKERDSWIHARLTGFEETPVTLSTTGHGTFKAEITEDNDIVYELTYADLATPITQSHIHFGRPATSGGIAAWLCGTPTNPGPATNPPPPCTSGSVTGTITAANVIGPAGQGIAPGEFQQLIDAIRAGATYANVHTTGRPGGEIRGLVR
jgi:hypothetical protein